jgi:3-oxoacyl-[acyl-carrier protein] reductase
MNSRRVLVTGGSRGIGREIALQLARDGWQVSIHYNSAQQEAESVLEELGDHGAKIYQSNLAHPENAVALGESVLQDGPIHALVNNAGIYIPVKFDAQSAVFDDAYRTMMNVNFESPVRLIRTLQAELMKQNGAVINVASRVGFRGEPGASIYAASKAALINLTRSLAVEYAQRLFVAGIAPGWVDTAMVRDGMTDRLPAILETLPLGRMATPADCAHATSFLLSPASRYLSGVVIDINGASYFH